MEIKRIAIVGAGTMGQGIAQVCATAGFSVQLCDIDLAVAAKAISTIKSNLNSAVAKGKLYAQDLQPTIDRITVSSLDGAEADLVIEAIVENLEVKKALFQTVEKNLPGAILASNTSTIPITRIATPLKTPGNCVGLHFFNPVPAMKLVEIIRGDRTSEQTLSAVTAFAKKLNKTFVFVKDSPGFIVNRVARPYYVEALKVLEEGGARMEAIDLLMKNTGMRMGPFELMDIIGLDVNLAVTTSLYEAFGRPARFEPNPIQEEKVRMRNFGVKTGKGFYEYPRK